jgi:hypothetical protein
LKIHEADCRFSIVFFWRIHNAGTFCGVLGLLDLSDMVSLWIMMALFCRMLKEVNCGRLIILEVDPNSQYLDLRALMAMKILKEEKLVSAEILKERVDIYQVQWELDRS